VDKLTVQAPQEPLIFLIATNLHSSKEAHHPSKRQRKLFSFAKLKTSTLDEELVVDESLPFS
jgi:hypothetical protein